MHKNSLIEVRRTSQVAKYSFDRLLKIVQVDHNDFLFNTYITKCSPHNPNTVKADCTNAEWEKGTVHSLVEDILVDFIDSSGWKWMKWSNGARQFLILYTKRINKQKTKQNNKNSLSDASLVWHMRKNRRVHLSSIHVKAASNVPFSMLKCFPSDVHWWWIHQRATWG